jgi:hypothetical protein
MSTARDLTLVVMDVLPDRPVEQGDLSLALAGAEAVDLLESGTLTLDGDHMVPGPRTPTGDRLLDRAAASLLRQEPYETVEQWLWRRGVELAAAYVDDLKRRGLITHPRGHGFRLRSARTVPAESPERARAEKRRESGEPVLADLLAVLGIGEEPSEADENAVPDAVTTVLAAVGDAVTQLEATRLRRNIENAAFDNLWRA